MERTVKHIIHSSTIGATPASVNLRTGVLTINPAVFNKHTPEQQKFILLHEAGHLAHQSKSEFKADHFALTNAINFGLTPKQAMQSILNTLHANNPKHQLRVKKLYQHYKKMNITDNYVGNYDHTANFFGKASRERRANRRTIRKETRQTNKMERIGARADGRALVAQSGGNPFLNQITDAASSILSSNGGYDVSNSNQEYAYTTKDNTKIYLGIAAAVVGVFIIKKKLF